MENEKLQINLAPGCVTAEIIVREVDNVNELPVLAPLKIGISGTLASVATFLKHRMSELDQINQKRCHIIVNREKITIVLVTNEHDEYSCGSVTGALSFYPKFTEFGINTGKVWTPSQLGMFFKMNRAFFQSREDNMKLVDDLMNFTAKVNNNIERSAKESGDKTDKFEQTVNSNLPKSFVICVPIFKGSPKETIEVETVAQVNGREISFTLISPGAQATIEEIRDNIIDEQIKQIADICPDIAIIEQ